ncbi:serine/threonine-protein kinase D6PK-like [Forsythia ovata]|uniref:Serine/threonine-protein kinase D6PK-like n=1 Tax=Forsythia ovata TaxID=205694 RepID=A0ABD1WS36_9LAMI
MPMNIKEPLVVGTCSLPMSPKSAISVQYHPSSVTETSRPPLVPSTEQHSFEGRSSGSNVIPTDHGMKKTYTQTDSVISSKCSYKTSHFSMRKDGLSDLFTDQLRSNNGKKAISRQWQWK